MSSLYWIDHAGIAHQLRPATDLSHAERGQLDVIRQQVGYVTFLLDARFTAPVISQARQNMVRMMLRLLLPNVTEQEIAAFDVTTGNDLLTRWWALTDTAAESTCTPAR